jgi:hypothetical protein
VITKIGPGETKTKITFRSAMPAVPVHADGSCNDGPLVVDEDGGYRCTKCGLAPNFQDIELRPAIRPSRLSAALQVVTLLWLVSFVVMAQYQAAQWREIAEHAVATVTDLRNHPADSGNTYYGLGAATSFEYHNTSAFEVAGDARVNGALSVGGGDFTSTALQQTCDAATRPILDELGGTLTADSSDCIGRITGARHSEVGLIFGKSKEAAHCLVTPERAVSVAVKTTGTGFLASCWTLGGPTQCGDLDYMCWGHLSATVIQTRSAGTNNITTPVPGDPYGYHALSSATDMFDITTRSP